MTTVYVVTSGEYSAYRIEAIFTTKPAADATRDLMNGPDGGDAYGAWKVEEWQLDEEPHRKAWACTALVSVGRQVQDGGWIVVPLDKPEVEVHGPALNDDESAAVDRVEAQEGWVWEREGEAPYQWSVRVTAADPERARKAAAERAYQVAAEWHVQVAAAYDRGEWR